MKRTAKKPSVNQENLPAKSSPAPKGIPLSKIVELHQKGLDGEQIAKILGCSRQAIFYRLQNVDLTDLQDFSNNDKLHIRLLQKRIMNSLTDSEINEMKGYEKVKSFAILQDKVEAKSDHVSVLNLALIVGDIDKRVRKQPQDIDIEPTIKQEITNDD